MILQAIVSFLFGVINCFFGWQLFRLVLVLWGFVTGSVIAVQMLGLTVDAPAAFIPLVFGGVLGAVLFSLLYVAGIVLLGAVFGFTLTVALVGSLLNAQDFTAFVIGALGAVIFGLLAWWLNKRIIFLITAFSGAAGIVNAGLLVLGYQTPVTDLLATTPTEEVVTMPQGVVLIALLAWLAVGAFGFMVQWGRVRR